MKKVCSIFVKFIALLIVISLIIPQDSIKEVFAVNNGETEDRIFLDVTYDPETKTYSLIGLSDQQLKDFGAPDLTDAIWDIIERFDNLSLEINGSLLNLKANDFQLAKIEWDDESRQLLYGLIDSYGTELSESSKERLDVWLDDANVVLNVRNSSEISQPLILNLDTLLYVDVKSEGQVSVEGFDTGFVLQEDIIEMVRAGNINNATLCWSEGELHVKINGDILPLITVYEEGLGVVDNALELGLGDLETFFVSQLGASISFDGSEHLFMQCGE
jgi:hypothetical protein